MYLNDRFFAKRSKVLHALRHMQTAKIPRHPLSAVCCDRR
jgi:hypothetical protein